VGEYAAAVLGLGLAVVVVVLTGAVLFCGSRFVLLCLFSAAACLFRALLNLFPV